MHRRGAGALVALAALILAPVGGCGGGDGAAEPGDKVNGMTLEDAPRGALREHIFDYCDPRGGPGTFKRSCKLPAVDTLHIGQGYVAIPDRIDVEWNAWDWELSLDGRSIDLDQFGIKDIGSPISANRSRKAET